MEKFGGGATWKGSSQECSVVGNILPLLWVLESKYIYIYIYIYIYKKPVSWNIPIDCCPSLSHISGPHHFIPTVHHVYPHHTSNNNPQFCCFNRTTTIASAWFQFCWLKHVGAKPHVRPCPNNKPKQYHILVTRGWMKKWLYAPILTFGF